MILSSEFTERYRNRPVNWGFKSGPNSIGEITYRRTYSRDDEKWWQTVARVVEGTYEILLNHCSRYHLPFDHKQARSDAEEMYERIFSFKFTPPGRGLWMMGTEFVRTRGSASLQNCGYVSTQNVASDFDKPFAFLMDMSMLGVGVGFDTRGAGKVTWRPSEGNRVVYVIPDSREGWVEATSMLLRWGFGVGPYPELDYSLVRKEGLPIKGFGGTSSGPGPLKRLHASLEELIRRQSGKPITCTDIVDVMNRIGQCVVAGNVRRTAEIAFGEHDDEEFLDLKNYEVSPHRAEYGWTSNNSVFAKVGQEYGGVARRIRLNGEPGLAWLENMRRYGRMIDPPDDKDYRVMGTNPCGEQSLENYELCTLVETYPHHHKDLKDFKRTLKYAYLYAKVVTLVPSHWPETNAVMLRNRRIGTSLAGVVQFLAKHGEKKLARWCDAGYEVLGHYDRVYSEWLCVRESIKKSSVKPGGTTPLLAGATPGGHYPTFRHYLRRIRFARSHPDLQAIRNAGYFTEPDARDPSSEVVELPVEGPDVPTETEVSLARKFHLAALLQRHWADNQVSFTATFHPEKEGGQIEDLLRAYDKGLKAISLLPLTEGGAYPQMPYEAITREQYESRVKDLKPIVWPEKVQHEDDEKYCDGPTCVLQL